MRRPALTQPTGLHRCSSCGHLTAISFVKNYLRRGRLWTIQNAATEANEPPTREEVPILVAGSTWVVATLLAGIRLFTAMRCGATSLASATLAVRRGLPSAET